ncbi:uncharacterized protein LOC116599493 [Mustela erminea]|uniref:uncharacterized protein LOC116599493 n=1 Tax=Mustela erminea TaxID=36723 RepID=UPI0013870781|nr:uncharacterized protein LOC116599493 [Mustela erminea]
MNMWPKCPRPQPCYTPQELLILGAGAPSSLFPGLACGFGGSSSSQLTGERRLGTGCPMGLPRAQELPPGMDSCHSPASPPDVPGECGGGESPRGQDLGRAPACAPCSEGETARRDITRWFVAAASGSAGRSGTRKDRDRENDDMGIWGRGGLHQNDIMDFQNAPFAIPVSHWQRRSSFTTCGPEALASGGTSFPMVSASPEAGFQRAPGFRVTRTQRSDPCEGYSQSCESGEGAGLTQLGSQPPHS